MSFNSIGDNVIGYSVFFKLFNGLDIIDQSISLSESESVSESVP